MTNRTTAWVAILALSAIVLPIAVNGQRQEAVSRGKPLSYWMERLDDRSDTTARAAIKEMGANALPDLMQALRQIDPSAGKSRIRALDAIGCLGPVAKPVLPDILPLVTNQNRQLKIQALFALQSIGPDTQTVKSVVPALIQTLGDEEWTMRLAAINALAALRPPPPETTPAFAQLLNDSNEMVSGTAMSFLVAQTNAVVIPLLDKLLHDEDSYVVTEAATQIGAFGAAAASSAPRLKELLTDPLSTVREAATNALAAITGHPLSHAVPDAKADISYNFPRIPFEQCLNIYEDLAGKKLTMEVTPKPNQTISLLTVRRLTKSEALQLLEEVLKEQARLVIVHGADGSLTAVAKPENSPH